MILKYSALAAILLTAACGTSPENDPVYQALLANAPTEIPAEYLPRLREGRFVCDVFEEGTPAQYMTCWFPSGLPPSAAGLVYYAARTGNSPNPSDISTSGGGGTPLTQLITFP